ncbi:MAG: putative deacylase [Saprospiraceae bacterium]|jgi:predicted deacylase
MSNSFSINGINIVLGEHKKIALQVSRLPSGTPIDIHAFVWRSQKPGPTLLVSGGVHGDEINGVEIVRRSIARDIFQSLKCGSVIAIPLLNVYGFINFSRDVPDGKDVNRSFPGLSTGSLASRVAYVLSQEILPLIDFGIDFHTGGQSHYNYPQIRYSQGDAEAKKLAEQFAGLCLIEKKAFPSTMRHHAMNEGKPILVYEGGENLRFDQLSIDEGLAGIKRVLKAKEMADFKTSDSGSTLRFNKTKWLRSPRAGIFRWISSSGEKVEKGQSIGVINDPYGQEETKIFASNAGFIIGHNNSPVVSQGDALFHIAW